MVVAAFILSGIAIAASAASVGVHIARLRRERGEQQMVDRLNEEDG